MNAIMYVQPEHSSNDKKKQTNVMIFKIVSKFRVVYPFDISSRSSQLPDGNKKNHDMESIPKSYYEI